MCQTVDCLCPACHPHEDKEVHIELELNLRPQAHTNTKGMGPLDVESNSKTEDALMLQDTTSLERPAVRRQACAKAYGCFRRRPKSSKHQLGVWPTKVAPEGAPAKTQLKHQRSIRTNPNKTKYSANKIFQAW